MSPLRFVPWKIYIAITDIGYDSCEKTFIFNYNYPIVQKMVLF